MSAVGGFVEASQKGQIGQGVAQGGFVSKAQQDAYNAAVAEFKSNTYSYSPQAEAFFQQAAADAMQEVSLSVDAFVEASVALVEVVTVNEMAKDAEAASDDRQAIELQEYVEANDVILDDQEVESYNTSLAAVESTAQIAGAYYAIANSPEMLEQANDQARQFMGTYEESTGSYFDPNQQKVIVSFDGYSTQVVMDVAASYVQTLDIVTQGQQSIFYQTSPVGGCWFLPSPEEQQSCLESKGAYDGS